jgi:CubicO group peptidase (beta-lactamase class C family)
MKILKFLAVLLLVLGLVILGLFVTGNQFLIKGVWATYLHGDKTATINDARFFDTRTIEAGKVTPWEEAATYNKKQLSPALREVLKESESVAFLVLKNGKIQHEQYWDGYSDSSRSNSFSMAKSITTILVQLAIQEGYIESWDTRVSEFLPGLEGAYRDELTLRHLTTMTAGLQWNEHYTNPFDITARTYYGPDVSELMLDEVPVVVKPGSQFEYQSGATQLLGMALTEASGMSVSAFASRYLWQPLGAVHDAAWHTDHKDGMELTFCCFNSNARDFARIGALMVDYGNWQGKALLDSAFVHKATQPFGADHYGHSFWLDPHQLFPIFYFRGILGQYIIVIPEKDMVIVRLGKKELEKVNGVHTRLEQAMVEEIMKYF